MGVLVGVLIGVLVGVLMSVVECADRNCYKIGCGLEDALIGCVSGCLDRVC